MGIQQISRLVAMLLASLLFIIGGTPHWNIARAASHREAPITALDTKADITDWYAFVSYEDGREDTVTLILGVDPLLEPSNGPNYFPFDPELTYKINIDNNRNAVDDLIFHFRFTTEIRLDGVFTGFVGSGDGIPAPSNAPLPPLSPVIPPAITALDGPGSTGLSLRQSYTVGLVNGAGDVIFETGVDADGDTLFAVPSNVGPVTMPDYEDLASQGIYTLRNGIRVFAGTTDDAFYIDLGAAFDTFNLRIAVLTAEEDANDTQNVSPACDAVSGFNVNTIAIEVPIEMLTSDGQIHSPDEPEAVIGTYGSTARSRTKTYNGPGEPATLSGDLVKIQRMGNALFNELIIPTELKDRWSMSEPEADEQFAPFALDPLVARVINAIFPIVTVPDAPRLDLLPLVQYIAPICPGCTSPGPIADLLRLNTGIPPTPPGQQSRLGFLTLVIDDDPSNDDPAGYPNGRRVFDDVTDITTRVGAGVLAGDIFNVFPNNRLGDGVNTNDVPYQNVFPYVAFANSGRNSRHIGPIAIGGGEFGCLATSQSGGSGCAIAETGTDISIGNMAFLLIPLLYMFGRRLVRRVRKS